MLSAKWQRFCLGLNVLTHVDTNQEFVMHLFISELGYHLGSFHVYVPSQWEKALHCNAFSDWLGTYIEWSLYY